MIEPGVDAQLGAIEALNRVEVKVTIPRSLYELIKTLGWREEEYFTWSLMGGVQGDMDGLFSGWKRAKKIAEDCRALEEELSGGDYA